MYNIALPMYLKFCQLIRKAQVLITSTIYHLVSKKIWKHVMKHHFNNMLPILSVCCTMITLMCFGHISLQVFVRQQYMTRND